MNTHSGKGKFKNFQILFDSRRSSTIVMVNMTSILKTKESAETMWETQAGKFTTSNKLNVDFCLPEFSSTKMVTWKCHVYESTNGRYGIILGRDLLTALGLNFKCSEM